MVNSVTNCAQVRACLSDGNGINYNSTTGVISACRSTDVNNQLVFGSDGCLYVPPGTTTVQSACGIAGNGSSGNPLRVITANWPFLCDESAGSDIYCDPTTEQLRGRPVPQAAFTTELVDQTFPNTLVPAAPTTVLTPSRTIFNPSSCLPAIVFVEVEVDVDFDIPPGGAAAYTIGTDVMYRMVNTGTTTMNTIHTQTTKVVPFGTIPAGGSAPYSFDVMVQEGAGGATYDRVQVFMRAFAFAL